MSRATADGWKPVVTCVALAIIVAAGSMSASAQTNRDSSISTMTGALRASERPHQASQLIVDPSNSKLSADNLSQLLSGRFAGVQVLSGSRIRIRGQSSFLLGNEPLIYDDRCRSKQ